MRTLVERASRWLVNNRRPPLDSQGTVDFFREPVQQLMAELPSLLTGRELRAYERRKARLVEQGVPEDLASRVAVLHPAYQLLGVIEIADRMALDPVEVTRLHFALGERLGLPDLVTRILELPRDDRWQTMARAALRDDVYAVHAQLTAQVLRDTDGSQSGAGPDPGVGGRRRGRGLPRGATLEEICAEETGRPGADVGRPPRRPRAARELIADSSKDAVTARAATRRTVRTHAAGSVGGDASAAPERRCRLWSWHQGRRANLPRS